MFVKGSKESKNYHRIENNHASYADTLQEELNMR